MSQSAILRTLHCLNPLNSMELYRLISKVWKKVVIVLLQQVRSLQTIVEALVYSHSRTGSTLLTVRYFPVSIPALCGCNLVHTILHRRIKCTLTATPTRHAPCDHDRCNLDEVAYMNRGTSKGGSLFCPVCKIFNHAAQHTKHIERALTSFPRLRFSLSKSTFLPDRQTAIIITAQNTRRPNDDSYKYSP